MDMAIETTEWGKIYYYTDEQYRFALYMYDDDKDNIYLANFDVKREYRNQGIGNRVLKLVVKESISHNAKAILLKCLKSSWVYDWYVRNGYESYCPDDNLNYVWLKYTLRNNGNSVKLVEALDKYGVVTLSKTLATPEVKHYFFVAKDGNIKHWTKSDNVDKVEIIPANIYLLRTNEWVKADPTKEEVDKILTFSA